MTTINFQPITAQLISTDTGKPVGFSLINHSNLTLKLYWIDRAGVEKLYQEIKPGDTITQGTMTSHAWLLKSDDLAFATKFLPSAGAITITPNNTTQFLDYSEKVLHTSDGLWSTTQGFGMIDAAKALGVRDVADLPTTGENNNLALNAMNAPAAWAAGFTGKGVKVAVVDAGIANSPELAGKIVAGYDFYDKDTTPTPDEGPYKDHALGVASIIAASHTPHVGRDTMGVAPDASLINVRVGSSLYGSATDAMANGIRYAVDQGAKVICMPLQSPSMQLDPQLVDAVHYAYAHNVVTVIIGGNFSNYGATGPALISHTLNGESLNVGNYNVKADALFDSSNMAGTTITPWVVASSTGWVPNSNGGYTYYEDGGTSFAGPYAAGLAALLWQQNPNASAAYIIDRITQSASMNADELPLQHGVMTNNANQVIAAAPNTKIDAGGGIDQVVFTGNHADYTISMLTDGVRVSHHAAGVNVLVNVERLMFADKAVAIDVGLGNGGDVYRLYQAAFDRTPDLGGVGFWMQAMDRGTSLHTVASGFVNSAEFDALYGVNPTDVQLVTAMYQNVLHRAPDQGGLDYWMHQMSQGLDDASLLTSFSNSAENQQAVAAIIGQGFEYIPFG
jgi:hypothetical protein